jgi:CRISPR-associated protein Cas1
VIGQVVEVVESDRHLSLEYGNMLVRAGGIVVGRVSLDSIQAVIVNPHGATLSAGILAELAERGIPVIISGRNFRPVATVVPLVGHHAIAQRIEAQVSASQPARKQAWKQIVRSKVSMQAMVLEQFGADAERLWRLEGEVRSGDPQNIEAQAARLYWPLLLGGDFRRNPDEPGLNALLNYGYAVVRAATARAITAAGLHPAIGVHHESAVDTMRLADDLMEPFRPLVDARVRAIAGSGEALEVVPRTKKMLVAILSTDVPTEAGTSPASVAMIRAARSLSEYFMGSRKKLELPSLGYRGAVAALAEAIV